MMVIHHFTLLVDVITSILPSTSSVRHIVTHRVRTIMVIHHFTLLVTIDMHAHIVQYLVSTGKLDPQERV